MAEKRPLNGVDVRAVASDCRVEMDEPVPDNAKEVTLFHTLTFYPEKIQYRIGFIIRGLDELPEEFQSEEGALLNLGLHNRDGELWGVYDGMEELEMLLMLGMAAGLVEILPSEPLPRVRVNLS